MSNLTKAFDDVFKDLRTDPYASEAETAALIKPDTRSPAEKRLHTMMDEREAWEQSAESFSVLRDIALELLTEQIKASTNDRRTKACLMACEGVSTEDLEAVMVNTGPLLKNKLAEVDLLRAENANLRAQPAVPEGWKLVPVEPTREMVDAGVADLRLRGYDRALIVAAIECYGAMLAAAPEKGGAT